MTNITSHLPILQDNQSRSSNWALSSYSMSLRRLPSSVKRLWASSSRYKSFFSHDRQGWNEYYKWEWMSFPYSSWKSAGAISLMMSLSSPSMNAFSRVAFEFSRHVHFRLGRETRKPPIIIIIISMYLGQWDVSLDPI